MREKVEEKALQFAEIKSAFDEKQAELERLQTEVWGDDSEETAKKAREFFDDVGQNDHAQKTKQIDALRAEIDELREKAKAAGEELMTLLGDVDFPLDGSIEVEDGVVVFPYSDPIDDEVLDAIGTLLDDELDRDDVEIDTDAIRAEADEVDEAMDRVKERIREIRSAAATNRGTDRRSRGSGGSTAQGSSEPNSESTAGTNRGVEAELEPTAETGQQAELQSDEDEVHDEQYANEIHDGDGKLGLSLPVGKK